jgi:hypothetical protein
VDDYNTYIQSLSSAAPTPFAGRGTSWRWLSAEDVLDKPLQLQACQDPNSDAFVEFAASGHGLKRRIQKRKPLEEVEPPGASAGALGRKRLRGKTKVPLEVPLEVPVEPLRAASAPPASAHHSHGHMQKRIWATSMQAKAELDKKRKLKRSRNNVVRRAREAAGEKHPYRPRDASLRKIAKEAHGAIADCTEALIITPTYAEALRRRGGHAHQSFLDKLAEGDETILDSSKLPGNLQSNTTATEEIAQCFVTVAQGRRG